MNHCSTLLPHRHSVRAVVAGHAAGLPVDFGIGEA